MDKIYTIFVSFHAKDIDDAANFVDSMSRNDWIGCIEEELQKPYGYEQLI